MRMINPGLFVSGGILGLLIGILPSCGGQNGSGTIENRIEVSVQEVPQGQPVIKFDTLVYDFGTIIEGERVVCYFDYSNVGGADLLITAVEVTCGCTTPDWSREPLVPGGTGSMKIILDASGRSGAQRKLVTVRSNAGNSEIRLTIKANVNENV